MIELLSLVLALKPLPAGAANPVAWWGRAAHALLLRAVAQSNSELATELHDASALRPFSVSNLLGRFAPGGELQAEQVYALRLTAYRPDVCQALLSACQPGGMLSEGSRVELDYQLFEVRPAAELPPNFSEWAAQTSYAELASPYLLASQPPSRHLCLQFASPTTFKSDGRHLPLPLPRLVFNSLLERWNAFAPLAFPPETRRYSEECLLISRYDLKTKPVPAKDSGLRNGMVGWAEFSTLNYDRYWMSLINALGRFAFFSGVGAGVSHGLGQCRLIEQAA